MTPGADTMGFINGDQIYLDIGKLPEEFIFGKSFRGYLQELESSGPDFAAHCNQILITHARMVHISIYSQSLHLHYLIFHQRNHRTYNNGEPG